MESDGFAFHKGAFSFSDPHIYHISRCDIGDKHHLSFMMPDAFPFGGDALDQQVGDDLIFHFSRHGRKIRENESEDLWGFQNPKDLQSDQIKKKHIFRS